MNKKEELLNFVTHLTPEQVEKLVKELPNLLPLLEESTSTTI